MRSEIKLFQDYCSVVLTTFNDLSYYKGCISTMLETADMPIELIVVDGGSKQTLVDRIYQHLLTIRKRFVQVKFIAMKERIVGAQAINIGVEASRGRHLFLCNDDMTFVSKEWVTRMIKHAEDNPDASVIGCVSNDTYAPQNTRDDYNTEEYTGQTFEIDQVAGMLCHMNREAWDKIGPYDENLGYQGGGDGDYSVRSTAHGYRLLIAKDVKVKHLRHGTKENFEVMQKWVLKKYGVPEIRPENLEHCIEVIRKNEGLKVPEPKVVEKKSEETMEEIDIHPSKARNMKISCNMSVLGRPKETSITIRSLARVSSAKQIDMNFFYSLPPSQCKFPNAGGIDFLKGWDKGPINPLLSAEEGVNLWKILEGIRFGFNSINIFTDVVYPGTPGIFRRAVENFLRDSCDYEWFIWVENDMLFNPDWFVRSAKMYLTAKQMFDVGIIWPYRTISPNPHLAHGDIYEDKDIDKKLPFLTRKRGPSGCWLIHKDVMFDVFTDLSYYEDHKWLGWDHDTAEMITEKGYTNIVARESLVQHIGVEGAVMDKKCWKRWGKGGLGFVPDKRIKDLYSETFD